MGIFSRRKRLAKASADAIEAYERELDRSGSAQFPHCDSLILHSPGICEYCDRRPRWQALRIDQGIAFSDETEEQVRERNLIPCPSTARRPAEVRDLWYGNVPKPARAP